jgi:paraquat-inducible protein B
MARGTHANYVKIGFSILIWLVAIGVTLVYLGGIRGTRNAILAETYYDRGVSGLSVGSAVNFRGVKIGVVREIDFVGNRYSAKGDDNLRIYILMALDPSKFDYFDDEGVEPEEAISHLVKTRGLRASVAPSGITGLSRIECDLDANAEPVEKLAWTPRHAYIPRKMSLLDNFSDAATRVVNQINTMDLVTVWSNVNASVDALSRTMQSVQGLVESCRGDVARTVENMTETISNMREFSQTVKENPARLLHDAPPAPLDETR